MDRKPDCEGNLPKTVEPSDQPVATARDRYGWRSLPSGTRFLGDGEVKTARQTDKQSRRPESVERDGERVTRYPGRCKGCGRDIWWVRTSTTMRPEDDDGRDHRETCTERVQFRRVQQTEMFR